ncbi:MAG: hypothetical protein UHN02_02175 [Acutalibacteraceae bacterium]|nr:hypothetical protein [Acutalibacteraceae bacterium]
MHTITPSKSLIPILRIWLCIFIILFAFIDGIIMVFSVSWALVFAFLAVVFFMWVWLFYIPAFAKNMLITISGASISISRGVFLKKKFIIPNARQVYAQRIKTPVDLIFDTTNITVNLVRGKVTMLALDKKDADYVMRYVSEVSKDN